jgi:hypothetical protein
MEQRLIAAGKRRPAALALGWRPSVGGGRDRAVMRGEADQHGVAAVPLAYELADVQLAALACLRCPRVAEMRIVRPDDRFRLVASIEVPNQVFNCLDHVPVAQIPR